VHFEVNAAVHGALFSHWMHALTKITIHPFKLRRQTIWDHIQQQSALTRTRLYQHRTLSLFSDNPILRHKIARQVQVGNLNFNHPAPRASGGALPMGGTGPSGTGPQIGGPHYLRHFTSERTVVTYSG